MYNTIRLLKGNEELTSREYERFSKIDTIAGIDASPEELNRWSIEQEQEALEELKKYNCSYTFHELQQSYSIEEYALEYFTTDEDGEFLEGSDYQPAETIGGN